MSGPTTIRMSRRAIAAVLVGILALVAALSVALIGHREGTAVMRAEPPPGRGLRTRLTAR